MKYNITLRMLSYTSIIDYHVEHHLIGSHVPMNSSVTMMFTTSGKALQVLRSEFAGHASVCNYRSRVAYSCGRASLNGTRKDITSSSNAGQEEMKVQDRVQDSSHATAKSPIRRVISLLPSATEILCVLPGGSDLLVGRSHECDFPMDILDRPVLTGQKTKLTTSADVDRQVSETLTDGQSLYSLDQDAIRMLKPDLILTQDICQVCAIDLQTVERLAKSMNPSPKIVSLNPASLGDVLRNVQEVSIALRALYARIQRVTDWVDRNVQPFVPRSSRSLAGGLRVLNIAGEPSQLPRPCVAFVEWLDPVFPAGHWSAQLIEMAGGWHPLNSDPSQWSLPLNARLQTDAVSAYSRSMRLPNCVSNGNSHPLVATSPDIIILAPCGLGIDVTKKELRQVLSDPSRQPGAKPQELFWWWQLVGRINSAESTLRPRVLLVDGSHMFNRPGPRLVDALEFLVNELHRGNSELPAPPTPPSDFCFEELNLEYWCDAGNFKNIKQVRKGSRI